MEMTDCWKAHPAFHSPWKSLRHSHIPHRPTATADGKVENQKQVSHFSTARFSSKTQKDAPNQTGKIIVPERKNT